VEDRAEGTDVGDLGLSIVLAARRGVTVGNYIKNLARHKEKVALSARLAWECNGLIATVNIPDRMCSRVRSVN
jgi:hypothetical protein